MPFPAMPAAANGQNGVSIDKAQIGCGVAAQGSSRWLTLCFPAMESSRVPARHAGSGHGNFSRLRHLYSPHSRADLSNFNTWISTSNVTIPLSILTPTLKPVQIHSFSRLFYYQIVLHIIYHTKISQTSLNPSLCQLCIFAPCVWGSKIPKLLKTA
jgi:hypothetical protein